MGTLGGIQYCNTVRKIDKYQNTLSKVDKIRYTCMIGHTYLKLYPSRVFGYLSYPPEIILSHREKM